MFRNRFNQCSCRDRTHTHKLKTDCASAFQAIFSLIHQRCTSTKLCETDRSDRCPLCCVRFSREVMFIRSGIDYYHWLEIICERERERGRATHIRIRLLLNAEFSIVICEHDLCFCHHCCSCDDDDDDDGGGVDGDDDENRHSVGCLNKTKEK